MRLAFVEMAGFRGFKDRTLINFPAGFTVITGRNGSGKSTVFDAIDFALTGTINKYDVKEAKGGGLAEHLWWVGEGRPDAEHVKVGFTDEGGELLTVTRTREGGLQQPSELAQRFCHEPMPANTWSETLVQTSLIRDESIAALSLDLPEQARFAAIRSAVGGLLGMTHQDRTKDILSASSRLCTLQQNKVRELQEELGRALRSLTEARSLAQRELDVVEAEEYLKTRVSELPDDPGERLVMIRSHLVHVRQETAQLREIVDQAQALQVRRASGRLLGEVAELEEVRAALAAASMASNEAQEGLKAAREREAEARRQDEFSTRWSELLINGEYVGLQEGQCPLCGTERTPEEFHFSVARLREMLTKGSDAATSVEATHEALRTALEAERVLAHVRERALSVEQKYEELAREELRLRESLSKLDLETYSTDIESLREALRFGQEGLARLEQALFTLEASGARDRVTATERRIADLRTELANEMAKLTSAQRAGEVAKQVDDAAREVPNEILAEHFETVMPLLKELYQRLRPHADWREIQVDFGGRIRASLNFTVGDGRNPQFLFSSGQRRAAGLSFLLAVHLSRTWCRLDSLLLDDPVQHIDDYRALNLVEVLSAVRRTGRQVIIAVEDPGLADVLCRRLRSSATEPGRRFDLSTAKNGSASIDRVTDLLPLPRETLKVAEA